MGSPSGETLDAVILEDHDQLVKLANLLNYKEEGLMMYIKSGPERVKYLKQCNESYENVISLLNTAKETHAKHEGDESKKDIAKNILNYVEYGLNMSMQNVRNCCLRANCITKIKAHFGSLAERLTSLDTQKLSDVQKLAEEVSAYKQLMLESTNKSRSGSARAISKLFSNKLKQEGTSFSQLVKRYQNELGYEGEFESLEEVKKYKIFKSIIDDSGRAEFPKLELASGAAGAAVLVFTASLMVWDIFTAEHPIEAALRNTLSALSEVGAFGIQILAEAAVTEAVMNSELGVLAVAAAGFVVGIVVGIVFIALSGLLIDHIFESGGNTIPDLNGLEFHTVGEMPDGMKLALQIAHQHHVPK